MWGMGQPNQRPNGQSSARMAKAAPEWPKQPPNGQSSPHTAHPHILEEIYRNHIKEENMEKKIMLGNEAIARGAYEAGVKVSAAYPGTPSTEISENIALYNDIYAEWSLSLIHI